MRQPEPTSLNVLLLVGRPRTSLSNPAFARDGPEVAAPAPRGAEVLTARQRRKRGAVMLAAELGLTASKIGRNLARHEKPHLCAIDPITGEAVRASRRPPTATNTALRIADPC
jgi:hypothetical protein